MQRITFSERPLHTVNPIYRCKGNIVRFTGELVTDGAQPDSPVIAANTSYDGPVVWSFSKPVTHVEFDAGYFDSIGLTRVRYYDAAGNLLQTVANSSYGVQHFSFEAEGGIARVVVVPIGKDPAGFSVDNVAFVNEPPQASLSKNADIDGILWGYKWDHTTLTYSFPTSEQEYLDNGYQVVGGFSALNAAQQDAYTKRILGNFADVCGISFKRTTAPAADLRFGVATSVDTSNGEGEEEIGTAKGFSNDPLHSTTSWGDCWFTPGSYDNPVVGSAAFAAGLMHELGHALGLKHGHVTQSGHGVNFPALPAAHDSYEYSIMTYHQFVGDTYSRDNAVDHPTTLMQNDIAALQYLYGADYEANKMDTVYRWDSNGELFVNDVGQGAPLNGRPLLTIWDGDGIDTYDFKDKTTRVYVDLRPGQWSTFDDLANLGSADDPHLARGNLANALLYRGNVSSLIENAYGGSGRDVLLGNVASNTLDGGGDNDILNGAGGADRLIGGAGRDIFMFNAALGASNIDTIDDFSAVDDTIRLAANVFNSLTAGVLNSRNFYIGAQAHDVNDYIIYNPGSGALYFDKDGDGATGAVQFAQLSVGLKMTAADFTVA